MQYATQIAVNGSHTVYYNNVTLIYTKLAFIQIFLACLVHSWLVSNIGALLIYAFWNYDVAMSTPQVNVFIGCLYLAKKIDWC